MKKPSVMKWCYDPRPGDVTSPPGYCLEDSDCPDGRELCLGGLCQEGCRDTGDCLEGYSCFNNKCYYQSGKVLVSSILVQGQCSDCSESTRVEVSLVGERTVQHREGVTCSSARVVMKESELTFSNNQTLNTCFKVNIKVNDNINVNINININVNINININIITARHRSTPS